MRYYLSCNSIVNVRSEDKCNCVRERFMIKCRFLSKSDNCLTMTFFNVFVIISIRVCFMAFVFWLVLGRIPQS